MGKERKVPAKEGKSFWRGKLLLLGLEWMMGFYVIELGRTGDH
jgi:hypothetical protein